MNIINIFYLFIYNKLFQIGFMYFDDKYYGKWNIYNMESFVSMIAVWKIKSLDLSINEEPRILNQLYHIDFPYLTEINLNENNIESV